MIRLRCWCFPGELCSITENLEGRGLVRVVVDYGGLLQGPYEAGADAD